MREPSREHRLNKIFSRLELVAKYDIKELFNCAEESEIIWRNLHFTLSTCYNDADFKEAERVMLFQRACRLEGIEFPPEIDMTGYEAPYDLYPFGLGISKKVFDRSKSKGLRIDSVHLYVEGWNDYAGASQGELGCYDMSTQSDKVTFRRWAWRRRPPPHTRCMGIPKL